MNASRLATLVTAFLFAAPAWGEDLSREELNFFETKIRPVLVRECYGCHSNKAGNVRGGLRLDTRELTHIGGGSGPAVVPGDLESSWLYNAITHQDFVMPPKRKLSDDVIADFRKWIEMGAPDPRTTKIAAIRSSISKEDIEQAREQYWAYQAPQAATPPRISNTDWPKSPIDRFVLSKLESAKLTPAADAEPWQVLRRLSFDLIGLPPSPEQIDSFTEAWKSDPDQAIAKAVDHMLDQPQFGERWGRHWLDVVRYAESTGREVNMTYPHAWRYRDYVIDAFNDDKPFHRFVQEQIAGDLLPVKTDEQWSKNLVATTFLALGPKNVNEQNPVQFAADVVDEQIDATTRVFLGMSVACARCHDHKFDAIPQADYYALAGVFRNMKTYFGQPQSEYGNFSGPQQRRNSSLLLLPVDDPNPYDKRYSANELAALKEEIEEKLSEMSQLRRSRGADGNASNTIRQRIRLLNELSQLSGKLGGIDANGEPRSYTMGVQDRDRIVDARILVRGEIDQAAQTVSRGFPQVLCSTPADINDDSSGRLELARWLGSDQNPLTARVMVNRVWQYMLGRGLVASTENFGVTGQPPSHPELLDDLAVRFMDSGWSVKSLVRDIATSRVYRMKTTFNEKHHEQDPDNTLLWRAHPKRLDAESIRDAMLSISGEIDLERPRGSEVAKAGYTRVRNGSVLTADQARERIRSSVRPSFGRPSARRRPGGRRPGFQMQQMGADMRNAIRSVTNQLDMEGAKFRSVYLPIVRDEEPRSLQVFDGADSSSIIGTRETSNTANQALYMMNNPFVIQQSDGFAKRISQHSSRPAEQIRYAFLLAYGREPTAGERSAAQRFIQEFAPTTNYRNRGQATLSALCQGLLGSAEFRYLD